MARLTGFAQDFSNPAVSAGDGVAVVLVTHGLSAVVGQFAAHLGSEFLRGRTSMTFRGAPQSASCDRGPAAPSGRCAVALSRWDHRPSGAWCRERGDAGRMHLADAARAEQAELQRSSHVGTLVHVSGRGDAQVPWLPHSCVGRQPRRRPEGSHALAEAPTRSGPPRARVARSPPDRAVDPAAGSDRWR